MNKRELLIAVLAVLAVILVEQRSQHLRFWHGLSAKRAFFNKTG